MKRLRSLFFWIHLISGVLASLIIAVMSATGAALAFEDELVTWLEPRVASGPRPPMSAWLDGVDSVTVFADGARAPVVTKGRGERLLVDGAGALVPAGQVTRLMHTLETWHRSLGLEGERRELGRALTGGANLLFVLLGLTGLVLWWPKKWSWQHVGPVLVFRRGLRGKQRDFNWHHVIGLWSVVALLAISGSGVVLSYRWAQGLVVSLAGEPPSAGPPKALLVDVPPDMPVLDAEVLLTKATAALPGWSSATWQREGRGPPAPEGKRKAVQVTVLVGDALPEGRHVFSFDPFSGAELQHEAWAQASPGRRARGVLRFLHTGQLFGVPGQALACLASLGTLVLVWTGLALSWRRFFRKSASTR